MLKYLMHSENCMKQYSKHTYIHSQMLTLHRIYFITVFEWIMSLIQLKSHPTWFLFLPTCNHFHQSVEWHLIHRFLHLLSIYVSTYTIHWYLGFLSFKICFFHSLLFFWDLFTLIFVKVYESQLQSNTYSVNKFLFLHLLPEGNWLF